MRSASEIVRDARRRHGLSQARLAYRAGTTQSAISRLERGEESVSLERLEGLLNAMGETLDVSVRRIGSELDPAHVEMARLETPGQRLAGAFNVAEFTGELRQATAAAKGGRETR